MWYSYTMKHYSVVKNKGIRKCSNKWIELEKNILSEVIQTEKDKYDVPSLLSGY